ncbi:MAG: hypothetical protein RR323_05900 [Raoultibacter sp.]
MKNNETLEKFGVTSEQLDAWEKDAANGIFQGEPRGEVVMGRPLMFGQQMRQVGLKEPVHKVEAIDRRAMQLGMKRSDYLRRLVDEDLKLMGMS